MKDALGSTIALVDSSGNLGLHTHTTLSATRQCQVRPVAIRRKTQDERMRAVAFIFVVPDTTHLRSGDLSKKTL